MKVLVFMFRGVVFGREIPRHGARGVREKKEESLNCLARITRVWRTLGDSIRVVVSCTREREVRQRTTDETKTEKKKNPSRDHDEVSCGLGLRLDRRSVVLL